MHPTSLEWRCAFPVPLLRRCCLFQHGVEPQLGIVVYLVASYLLPARVWVCFVDDWIWIMGKHFFPQVTGSSWVVL